ncbi:MAG: DUF4332 domain-containing protein [Anaerolineae bacterium]|nr:DUF4332 domain-containing protein [Anaerolineae bacterium]
MLDRSVRTGLAVMALLAAIMIALRNIVLERPLEDWWLVLILLLLAVFFGWWMGRTPAVVETDEDDAAAMQPRVRQFLPGDVASETPALAEPAAAEAEAVIAAPAAAEPEAPPAAEAEILPFMSAAADDLKLIEGIGPQMEQALKEAGIDTFGKVAGASVQDLRAAIEAKELRFAPSLVNWSKQARYLADGDQPGFETYRDYLVRGLEPGQVVSQDYSVTIEAPAAEAAAPAEPVVEEVKAAAPAPEKKPKAKAKAKAKPKAEAKPRRAKSADRDDLKRIEGIGPKMEKALNAAGIETFARLAEATDAELHAAIEAQGMRFAPSIPTWARQAEYLARGDEAGFEAYKEHLTAGREPD